MLIGLIIIDKMWYKGIDWKKGQKLQKGSERESENSFVCL